MKNTRNDDKTLFESAKPQRFGFITKRASRVKTWFFKTVEKRPVFSFFLFLALLVGVIAVGNTMRKPPEVKEEKASVKQVSTFSIGKAPRLTFSGTVEKSGVIQITAQTAGVVQGIKTTEGTKVTKGTNILWMSTNYQGANLPSVTREIAQKSYDFSVESQSMQDEMLKKRREIAEKSDTAADDQRNILHDSIEDTKSQISLNEEILNTLNAQLDTLEGTNVGGINDATILQVKQGKSGIMAALSGLKAGLRTTEYQSEEGNAPAKLSDLGKDLTLKQLELEERSQKLSRELASLNLKIAQIGESLMYPSAACSGVIEHVNVNVGQAINPGTLLATMVCDKNAANIVVKVSSDVAKNLSRLENSRIIIGDSVVDIAPRYISTEAVQGGLHVVLYTLPEETGRKLTDSSSVTVEIPMGGVKATAVSPYVPIDAIFQTQTSSFLYVASASAEGVMKAYGKEVTLGQVYGSYVEVAKGLSESDQVILNRNVISGDEVTIK